MCNVCNVNFKNRIEKNAIAYRFAETDVEQRLIVVRTVSVSFSLFYSTDSVTIFAYKASTFTLYRVQLFMISNLLSEKYGDKSALPCNVGDVVI